MGAFIDFKYVVQQADVLEVLDQLGITYKVSGDEARYRCHMPDHKDNKASNSINLTNKQFFCQGCRARGDILELVATVRDISKRDAAELIADWSGCALASPDRHRGRRSNAPSGSGRKASHRQEREEKPWEPFTRKLSLDQTHEFGLDRFGSDMTKLFEMGFQNRGMFADRWCVPVHDAGGNQLGYFGRSVTDDVADDAKWLIPPGFPKSHVLFNLHRVLAADTHDQALVVVEGIGDAIALHGRGLPVVACLGTALSEVQADLIEEHGFDQVCLLFDGDEPGHAGAIAAAGVLASRAFVRIGQLLDGVDPEDADDEALADALWWL